MLWRCNRFSLSIDLGEFKRDAFGRLIAFGSSLPVGMPLVLVMISACVDTGAYLSNEHR